MDMPVNPSRPALSRGRTAVKPEWLIEAWMDLLPPQQAAVVRQVHHAVMAASSAIAPSVKWGNLLYTRHGRVLAQLTPHRHAVHLQLAQPRRPGRGASGVAGVGLGRGADAGALRIRLSQDIDGDAITAQVVRSLQSLPR